ncbi:MAG: ATP-binding protein [Gammaproteobacteria bacterium]
MEIVLKYLLLLRSVVIVGQLVGLVVIDHGFHVDVPWWPVLTTLTLLTVLTIHSWRELRAPRRVSARAFVVQLLADIAALSVLVFFTGGSLNPFITLFLLPIIFAAASLPSLHTAIVAGSAALAYTTLMFVHQPVHHAATHVRGIDLHIWGMWYGFLLSAACVAAFVARIARVLREQDAALAEAREQVLRNERVVALGTLAAGTAHELGTPLATMSIIAHDLATDLTDQPGLKRAVQLLQGELRRCKETLARLAVDAGQLPAEEGGRVSLRAFLEQLWADFRALNPGVELRLDGVAPGEACEIVADRTLRQALLNILNNAAEASRCAVMVSGTWTKTQLTLEIADDGPGISREVRPKLGRAVITSKDGGMGIGIYLAATTLQRFGGAVQFMPRPPGGTCVRVELPLSVLRADPR